MEFLVELHPVYKLFGESWLPQDWSERRELAQTGLNPVGRLPTRVTFDKRPRFSTLTPRPGDGVITGRAHHVVGGVEEAIP